MFSAEILKLADELIVELKKRNLTVATAESCTGGLVIAALTAIPGSSEVVDRGFITYSNAAKVQDLYVPFELFTQVGSVSEAVAKEMAQGAIVRSQADVAIAVTGIAGPTTSPGKPIGLVHFAVSLRNGRTTSHERHELGDIGRDGIRLKSVEVALTLAVATLRKEPSLG